jgi:uncharacterized Tic20 family protein
MALVEKEPVYKLNERSQFMADVNETPKPTEANKDARMFAMLAHLLAIFTCFVGPLVIWLIKKDEQPFVEEQGKEALNFQITVAIAYVVATLLPIAGCFLAPAVWVVNLIFCIMACVAANKGEHYRYPVSLRLIK